MDARRLLMAAAGGLAVAGCAARPTLWPTVAGPTSGPAAAAETGIAPQAPSEPPIQPSPASGSASPPAADPEDPLPEPAASPPPVRSSGAGGRAAIAAANIEARVTSSAGAFVGGMQVFAFEPGRVYEVWTAPLRVTTLSLATGETLTSTAAGDTLRWQIGASGSGEGASARTHVLIKPLQAGLETNLVLTTTRRLYLIQLRSGAADAFNAAVAWDAPVEPPPTSASTSTSAPPPLVTDGPIEAAVDAPPIGSPIGIDTGYRIRPLGRAPRWTPTAVFNDGARTFILLDPVVAVEDAPALFVLSGGEPMLTNYRQSGATLVVDQLFDAAELRLGGRRPQVVRLTRLPEAAR